MTLSLAGIGCSAYLHNPWASKAAREIQHSPVSGQPPGDKLSSPRGLVGAIIESKLFGHHAVVREISLSRILRYSLHHEPLQVINWMEFYPEDCSHLRPQSPLHNNVETH